MAGLSLANEHLPAGALPSFTLPFAGTLQIWFENTDVFGCTAWDSSYGANYSFAVAPPANAPGWVGGRARTCSTAPAATAPATPTRSRRRRALTFDTWARQQAVVTAGLLRRVEEPASPISTTPTSGEQLDVQMN